MASVTLHPLPPPTKQNRPAPKKPKKKIIAREIPKIAPEPNHFWSSDEEDGNGGRPVAIAAEEGDRDLDDDLEERIFSDAGNVHCLPPVQLQSTTPTRKTVKMDRTGKSGGLTVVNKLDKDKTYPLVSHISSLDQKIAELTQLLTRKDAELAALRQEAVTQSAVMEQGLFAGGGGEREGGRRDARMIELAKKARRLNVALERERDKNKALNATILRLNSSTPATVPPIPPSTTDPLLKQTKEKLSHMTRKYEDERIAAGTLRREVGVLKSILVREVGEEIDFGKSLDGQLTGWKGRAQQILTLKAKLKDLKRRPPPTDPTTSSPPPPLSTLDDRHRTSIRTLESQRRAAHDQTTKDLATLKISYKSLQQTHKSTLARIQILEQQLGRAKGCLATLVGQVKGDEALIRALKDEMKGEMAAAVTGGTCEGCIDRESTIATLHSRLSALPPPDPTNPPSQTTTPHLQSRLIQAHEHNATLQATIAALTRKLSKQPPSKPKPESEKDAQIESLTESLEFIKDENRDLKVTLRSMTETHQAQMEVMLGMMEGRGQQQQQEHEQQQGKDGGGGLGPPPP